MSKHVLLLPGLGDHHPQILLKLIKHWPLLGVSLHFQPINWNDNEPWNSKLTRINSRLDELSEKYGSLGVVAISAGASAALNVYALKTDKINKLVFICGKIAGLDDVNPNYYKTNPAFKNSLADAQSVLNKLSPADKIKMLAIRPLYDEVVHTRYSKIPGVRQLVMLSAGHSISIGAALTIYSPIISRFLIKPTPI